MLTRTVRNQCKFFRIWLKTWIMIYFGAQNAPEIGPLRRIFNTHINVAQIGTYTRTDAKPVDNVWESDQRPGFRPIFGSKWDKNLASEAHIIHITKYLQCASEIIPMWNPWKLLKKWPKTGISTHFGAQNGPKIGPLRPIFPTSLNILAKGVWSHADVKIVKPFWECDQRGEFGLVLGPITAQKCWLWSPYCIHLWT